MKLFLKVTNNETKEVKIISTSYMTMLEAAHIIIEYANKNFKVEALYI